MYKKKQKTYENNLNTNNNHPRLLILSEEISQLIISKNPSPIQPCNFPQSFPVLALYKTQ